MLNCSHGRDRAGVASSCLDGSLFIILLTTITETRKPLKFIILFNLTFLVTILQQPNPLDSFVGRTVNAWNGLPASAFHCNSVSGFKRFLVDCDLSQFLCQ